MLVSLVHRTSCSVLVRINPNVTLQVSSPSTLIYGTKKLLLSRYITEYLTPAYEETSFVTQYNQIPYTRICRILKCNTKNTHLHIDECF